MNPNDKLLHELEQARNELSRLPSTEARRHARESFLVGTSVTSNGDMRHSDHSALMQISNVTEGDQNMFAQKTRRLRLIAAVLLGVLLAGGFWAVPPLRTVAQEVINFFIPDQDDSRSEEIYIGGQPHESAEQAPGELVTMFAQAPFDARFPTFIPEGFRVEDARVDHDVAFITLTCTEPWAVLITQRVFDGDFQPFAQEVGASAVIETVDINGASGQYVHGTWDVVMPDNFEALRQNSEAQGVAVDSIWDSNLPWGRLVWMNDGILFELMSAGGIMSEDSRNSLCAPNLDMFANIARGLIPNSEAAP